MNRASAVVLIGIALVATGVAVWAGPNLTFAAPAAAVAVLAAGFLFVSAWMDNPPEARSAGRDPEGGEVRVDRLWFQSGRLGREEIIATLDRIERLGPTPDLPARSGAELSEITGLSRSEFRAYVRRRLEDLEARS
jgi:hypothetical protein